MDRIERFLKKIEERDDGCWEWIGAGGRYGHFWNGRQHVGAHRWAFEYYKYPIPEGFDIDHLCENQRCVNPEHLETVTRAENIRRWVRKHKTHCVQGHEYTLENTYWHKNRHNASGYQRVCRTCHSAKTKRQRQHRKG